MPELPEVEVVRQGLEKMVGSKTKLKKIELMRRDLREPFPVKKLKALEGAMILGVRRRAKYLLIETTQGTLLSHLGMTGTWRLAPSGEERDHDHVYLYLDNGQRWAYRDPRRFGYLGVMGVGESHVKLESLGVEPLEPEFDVNYLLEKSRGRKVPLKAFIMDQRVVVGVGNIYASEALFAARINPLREAHLLTRHDAQKLIKVIKNILTHAIQAGGSSISDFTSAKGGEGYFQKQFKVYSREGEVCFLCKKSRIKNVVIAGRSTFFCPTCQK